MASSSGWAASNVTTRFNGEWFIPSGSHADSAVKLQNEHFGGRSEQFGVYTGPSLNGFNDSLTQLKMIELSNDLEEQTFVQACISNWQVFVKKLKFYN